MNADTVVNRFRKREKDTLADEIRLNYWSQVLITHLIHIEERRLQDSDVAVEADQDPFWEIMS